MSDKARDPIISHNDLLGIMSYDAETGQFRWKKTRNNKVRPGALAGHVGSNGYRRITLRGKRVMAHRLAWFYVTGAWPPNMVDHINGNVDDNRLENLRLATRSQNLVNQTRNKCDGLPKGVHKKKDPRRHKSPYVAMIGVGSGKQKTLGHFSTIEDAKRAYDEAAIALYGAFAKA